jgi:predicted nuclease of predicted toxin-antitoxin system
VKLLLDQNLSRFLVDQLETDFPGSTHVALRGLAESDDKTVWDYAKTNGYIIVSKDSDFRQLSFLHGHPPKTIWLRIGNSSTSMAKGLLTENVTKISQFDVDEESALLVLPPEVVDTPSSFFNDAARYDPEADERAVRAIVRHLGIALRSKDASEVSCSDRSELEMIREKWLKQFLGLTEPDPSLDAEILSVCAAMGDGPSKSRVTFYYLLAKNFGKLQLLR